MPADPAGLSTRLYDQMRAIDRVYPKANEPRFPRVLLDDATIDLVANDCIKGLIPGKSLVLVYGPSGDGKTFFVLDLVAHLAAGLPWRNRRVRPGLVVYVAAEAGRSIVRRFVAWREKHLTRPRANPTPLAIITSGPNLLQTTDFEALVAELRALAAAVGVPLSLVVIDTLSRSIPGGDENRSEDMSKVIAAADAIRDQLDASTVVVHHSGKDGKKGARGHSSLFGAADVVIRVVKRVATVEKARDGSEGGQFPFALDVVRLGEDTDGEPVTTCIVRHLDGKAPAHTDAPVQAGQVLFGVAEVAFQALQQALDEHGENVSAIPTIPPEVPVVTLQRWRSSFRLRYGKDEDGKPRDQEAIKKAFFRGRNQLAAMDAVCISDPYVWLTAKSGSQPRIQCPR